MNKQQFITKAQPFISWLINNLPSMRINLRMRPSRYVPGGLERSNVAFEDVPYLYIWKAKWVDGCVEINSDDWLSTKKSLNRLRKKLIDALRNKCEEEFFSACKAVLQWGGVNGANKFLLQLHDDEVLMNYFCELKKINENGFC